MLFYIRQDKHEELRQELQELQEFTQLEKELQDETIEKLEEVINIIKYRLLDSPVVECWLQFREDSGSIPNQGPRHTKDVIKVVPVVAFFSTEH